MKRLLSLTLAFVLTFLVGVGSLPSIVKAEDTNEVQEDTNNAQVIDDSSWMVEETNIPWIEQDVLADADDSVVRISTGEKGPDKIVIPIIIELIKEAYEEAKKKGKKADTNTRNTSTKTTGKPYSSRDIENKKSGKVVTRRYFDGDGRADLDIDYNNHGNPKKHPKVPHRHNWKWKNGKSERGKGY
ncbi:hypothetical protein [Marininema halotolerans]|uniref:Uncharacterized protein n=1 Tax=Marininema halotolerans TaxID=1155944 RepID=A0A1I6QJB5_9BACL|nr:hypothetical protein [Marininema halotolerans]SFS52502.1 hypothetical protein SAMN05444972_103186 [Marininema halotolerans]